MNPKVGNPNNILGIPGSLCSENMFRRYAWGSAPAVLRSACSCGCEMRHLLASTVAGAATECKSESKLCMSGKLMVPRPLPVRCGELAKERRKNDNLELTISSFRTMSARSWHGWTRYGAEMLSKPFAVFVLKSYGRISSTGLAPRAVLASRSCVGEAKDKKSAGTHFNPVVGYASTTLYASR